MASGSVPCSASPSGPAVAAKDDPNREIDFMLRNHLKVHNIGEHSFNVCWLGPAQDSGKYQKRTGVACVTICFEFMKQMQEAGITCMQQLVYAVTSGKIMEEAIEATAKARKAAHRDYQVIPDAFKRYKNVLEKDGEKEQWGSLIDTLTLFPFPQAGQEGTIYEYLPNLIDPTKGFQSDRIRMALLTYGAGDGCGHTFLVVWLGSLLFFIDSLSNGLVGASQRAFMIVCRSPEDVKRYLDYRFRVRKRFPVHEPEGEELAKLQAQAAAAAAKAAASETENAEMQWGSGPYTKYQIELSFFKLRALGPAERGPGPRRQRQSIEAAEQERDKATEAQPQSNAENPTMLRKELQQKDRVMENLLQSHDELQAKLKQVSDQLAEEQRGGQERMRVAKEAEKNLQGQIQSQNTELGKALDRAKEKAREWGDAQKQLSSNRGLLKQRDTEVKNLKERLKAAEQQQSGNLGKGAKDAGVAAAHERELEEIKKLLKEKEATIQSLLGKQDQRAGEVADLQKERDELLKQVKSQSDKARQAIETEKQAAETEAAKRHKTELELWDVKQQLNKLRDQEKGWTNETVGLQKKLEDAKNAAAKEAKGRADVEEDLKERLRASEKLVDELQNRVKEAEKNGVAAAAGEVEGQRKKGEELRAQEAQKWSQKMAELQQKHSAATERERLAIEREKTLQGQLRDLKESSVAELEKLRGAIEAELASGVETIDRIAEAKVKAVEKKLAKCQADLSNSTASLRRLSVGDNYRREQATAMSQKTEQAEKEAAELRLKLQSTEKDLQGSQHELEMTKHALERAKSTLGAARLEQERLQTRLDAAPDSPLEPQELENALAQVEKFTNTHEEAHQEAGALEDNLWGLAAWPVDGEAGHLGPEDEQVVEGSMQSPDPAKAARKAVGTKRGRQEEAPLKKKRARGEKVERSGEKARKKQPTWEEFWAKESELSKAAFEACHSRTKASLTQCGDHACKKRSSAFCSGCQIAYCKYMGAKCWGKAHTVLYLDFLKEAKAEALKKFKEKKKSK